MNGGWMGRQGKIESCIVVGAGMAGLVAARRLQDDGIRVIVLDKGRGVGGRMATRRIGRGVCDHGAQFFTVRDPRFGRLVEEWQAARVVRHWCRGFVESDGTWENDGHSRYRGDTGMTAIAKYLARDVDVRVQERVIEVKIDSGRWRVRTAEETIRDADALVLTPPVPQSLALIDAGGVDLPRPSRDALEQLTYDPCIVVMAVLSGPSRVPPPGGLRLPGEPVAWIADNHQKGISPGATAVTIHSGPAFGRAYWNSKDEEVIQILVDATRPWLGSLVQSTSVHRWRYSQPVQVYPEPCLFVAAPAPLVFAGDAFGGARIEGAALSGLAASDQLLYERGG